MSYISDTINDLDIPTRILYNRSLAQLGVAAFRTGDYRGVLSTLGDLYNRFQRLRELLGQGVGKDEDSSEAKRHVYPYHMFISIDLLDSIHLISGAIVEVPHIAEFGPGSKRISSKFFRRRYLDYFHHHARLNQNLSSIDSPRDAILVAAHNMSNGNWKVAWDLILDLKFWSSVHQSKIAQQFLLDSIKIQSLKCYLLTVCTAFNSIDLDVLINQFQLPESSIVKTVSNYAFNEVIHAAWSKNDRNKVCLMFAHHSTPTSHKVASQFLEKIQTINAITSSNRYK